MVLLALDANTFINKSALHAVGTFSSEEKHVFRNKLALAPTDHQTRQDVRSHHLSPNVPRAMQVSDSLPMVNAVIVIVSAATVNQIATDVPMKKI